MKTTIINEESVKSLEGCKDVFDYLATFLRNGFKEKKVELVLSNSYEGCCNAPSGKKKYYRTCNFVFAQDSFKTLNELMDSTQICVVVKEEKKNETRRD